MIEKLRKFLKRQEVKDLFVTLLVGLVGVISKFGVDDPKDQLENK